MRKDHFTDETVAAAKALAALKYSENPGDQQAFSEAYDFARCQRPDGSFYGTAGTCRKGSPAGAKQEEPKAPKAAKPKSSKGAKPKTGATSSSALVNGKTVDQWETLKKSVSKDARTLKGALNRGSAGEDKIGPALKGLMKSAEELGRFDLNTGDNAADVKKLFEKRRGQGGVLDRYDRQDLVASMIRLANSSNSTAKRLHAVAVKKAAG
jgi:hypothetical protein